MDAREHCNFFLLRYVPDAVKNEFVNIGLVLLPEAGSPELRFARDLSRVKCLDPQADLELLESFEADLRGKLHEANGDRDFILRKIQDSFSNALQPSEFKACLAESPAKEADTLAQLYLEPRRQTQPREAGARQVILDRMQLEFERTGAWKRMHHSIAVADFANTLDPFKVDCGYSNNGTVKMFHALALNNDMSGVNTAKVLAFSFPPLAEGINGKEGKRALLTAIVTDDLPRDEKLIAFALETLEKEEIAVAPVAHLPAIAAQAARELGIQ
jgi:hypothetical protein